jgi:uncharacterized protein (DUF302 family)
MTFQLSGRGIRLVLAADAPRAAGEGKYVVLTRKIDVERLTFVSPKPFDAVVSTVEQSIGHPDIAEIGRAASDSTPFSEFERLVNRGASASGLMLFMKLDVGAVLSKESGLSWPRAARFLIGNPLIMKEMARHVPEAASYAPITLLVDERSDGVHLGYDKVASFLASYGNAKALAVARDLDGKIETLMRAAAE